MPREGGSQDCSVSESMRPEGGRFWEQRVGCVGRKI